MRSPGARRLWIGTAAVVLVASLGASSEARVARSGQTYPGDVRGERCPAHWYTGTDDTARLACTEAGYRIAFFATGQDLSLTHIAPTRVMTVNALVRVTPGREHPILNPGAGCFQDAKRGWLGQIGSGGRWAIAGYRSHDPIAHGTSAAVGQLSRPRRIALTCRATGARMRLTLRVNGSVVARDVDGGPAVAVDRFGVWAAGEAGATLLVSSIVATTT